MKRDRAKRLTVWSLGLVLAAAMSAGAEGYDRDARVYDLRPRPDREMALDCIGATGIKARIYPGVRLKVEGTLAGSPADGKFETGQIIAGVNGESLQGVNPFVALGRALTEAEATDGKLVFDVQSATNTPLSRVTVTIPVLGRYSETWPLDCDKSKAIIEAAARYYASDPEFRDKYFNDKSENGGIPSALACLFLLSTGEDEYVPVVKDYFAGFPKDLDRIGDHTWNNGYNGIACAEYYLRTGDRGVLPILQYYCDNAKERQCFGSGWPHWGRAINPRYVAGGLMNPAGAQVLTTLLLGKACGVQVDDATLLGALRFWYRFVGHGTVPYGDHRAEGGLGSNGKDGMAAAAMKIATGARGNTAIYEQALQHLGMATLTSYPNLIRGHGDAGRGDGIWRGVASAYMLDVDPEAYHTAMNRLTWWYDLSRRPSGALGMATCQRFDDVGSGAGVALAYTAPLKTLHITGAPRSPYAKDFTLPETLWGNETDLAFLSIEPGSGYGKDEPIHVPFYRYGNAYRKAADLADVARGDMLRNVHHKRYVIRSQAAKALRAVGAFEELERLLRDDDPRVRRAALDGMCDYRYWFHIGKSPMRPEQFTPGMVEAVTGMLEDPDEAWYVVDGALMVLSLMPPETIGDYQERVMPWTTHEEWWLRQSAFAALASAATDEELLPRVLPTMLDMMQAEDHTQPRQGMLGKVNRLLKKRTPSSEVGRQILAAHMQAAANRRIIPGVRAGEGEYDVGKSVDVLLREAPARALAVARMLQQRFDQLTTGRIVGFANSLRGARDEVPEEQRDELAALLHGPFRQVLIERMQAEGDTLALVDGILALTQIEQPTKGWVALGRSNAAERVWRCVSIEPTGDDRMHPREKKRFRDVTLPDALKGWFEPAYDDRAWQEGRAPIGKGVFRKRNVSFENCSEWGDGEFLLMRSTFQLDAVDFDYYRISVLAKQGFRIYLNGRPIHTYIWWKDDPHYRKIMLSDRHSSALLRKGANHLAVYAGSEYVTGSHVAQIDVFLEGLRTRDLLGE